MMFTRHQIENILFIDVETASQQASFEELSDRMQMLWEKKAQKYLKADSSENVKQLYQKKAAIHPEFARAVCISCGYIQFNSEGIPDLTLKSYAGEYEPEILSTFGQMLTKFMAKDGRNLCAHNGKEFDFPFLGKRFLIQGIPLPDVLQIQGKKPWEVSFVDTMDLWRFGDYKSYISLDLLATVLGVPSPKDDIDGSEVSKIFWQEKNIERIQIYCEKDVKTTAQILLRMCQMPMLPT